MCACVQLLAHFGTVSLFAFVAYHACHLFYLLFVCSGKYMCACCLSLLFTPITVQMMGSINGKIYLLCMLSGKKGKLLHVCQIQPTKWIIFVCVTLCLLCANVCVVSYCWRAENCCSICAIPVLQPHNFHYVYINVCLTLAESNQVEPKIYNNSLHHHNEQTHEKKRRKKIKENDSHSTLN